VSKYPSIPDFYDPDSMQTTVRALKDTVEQLAGLRQGGSLGAPSVYVQEIAPAETRGTVLQRGDVWVNSVTHAAAYWTGSSWQLLA